KHQFRTVVVILTDVFERVDIRRPAHCKYLSRPWLGVGAGIVDGHLILKGINSRTSESLGEFELFRVRRAARVEPELLVQADCLDHKRVAFPMTDRMAVVGRIEVRGMRASIHIDDAVRVWTAHVEDVDALQIGNVYEFSAV